MDTTQVTDRFYSWIVLTACTIMQFLTDGTFNRSFGLFNVAILEEFKKSVSITTLITGILNGTYCIASLPVMIYLIKIVEPRTIIITGSIMIALGACLSCLAPNIYFLFFSLSILVGLGVVFVLPPGLVVLGMHFSERRATANGIAMAGCCLGGLVCPPLYLYILDVYGLRGALLLTGGILLNNIPMACLLKSPTSKVDLKKESIEKTEQPTDKNNQMIPILNENDHASTSFDIAIKQETLNSWSSSDLPTKTHTMESEKMITRREDLASASDMFLYQKPEKKYHELSLPVLFRHPSCNFIVEECLDDSLHNKSIITSKETKLLKNNIVSKLLKNPSFVVFIFAIALANTITSTFLGYLPLYGTEHHIENDKIVILVSLTGACDFLGRILCGLLADMHIIKIPYIIALSQAICGITYTCNQLMTTFPGLICFTVLIGLFNGMYLPLMHAMTVETVGHSLYPTAVSILIVSQFPIFIIGPLVFGLLRDSTGNYIASFHVIGAVGIVSALLLVCVPIIERCSKPNQTENSQTNK